VWGFVHRHRIALALGAVAALCVAWLVVHARRYGVFFADDSFISLRYSQRLLQGRGLGWNDGEAPVEGYSNFLWVIGCALVGIVSKNLVSAARTLGLLSSAAAIVAVVWLRRPTRWSDLIAGGVGGVAMALSGTVAVWAIGGLEQPLLIALYGWGLWFLLRAMGEAPAPPARRTILGAGVLFGLLSLTRPDAPLLWCVALAAFVLAERLQRDKLMTAVKIGAIAGGILCAHLVFRRLYYHDWVPNTAYAKVVVTEGRLSEGKKYVLSSLRTHLGLGLLAAAGLPFALLDRSRRSAAIALLAPLGAWCVYVAVIGGDIFPGRRHFAPAVLLLAMLATLGLGAALARFKLALAVVPAVAIAALVWLRHAQYADKQNTRAIKERWEWKTPPIAHLLKKHFLPRDPLMAADALGAIAFMSGLRTLDMLGLNDHYLAHHRPKDMGKGFLGHELGDGQYFLRRNPDLVFFLPPGGVQQARFRGGVEMQADPRFHQRYVAIKFESTRPFKNSANIWVNWQSERIGLRQDGGAVRLPGYLLASTGGTVAAEDGAGKLSGSAPQGKALRFDHLPALAAAGRRRFEVIGSGGPATLRVGSRATGALLGEGAAALELDIPADAGELWLEAVPATKQRIFVHEVVIRPL